MNKKLLMLLAAGALVITGCATKGSTKEEENKTDQKNTTEQTNNKEEAKKENNVETVKHDLNEADKLVRLVAISGNDLSRISTQTNFLHWITQTRVVETKTPSGTPLYKVSSADYLDMVNEYSPKTYNMQEALDLLKGNNYNEYDINSSASSLYPSEDEVHYYLGDKEIVFSTMILGNNYPQEVEPQDKWVIEGDTIKINVLDSMTKTKLSTITLKLNNKQYTGGKEKTKYYVEKYESFAQ